MAEPYLPGSQWYCYGGEYVGWASYGPYGSSVAIAGSGAHVIDPDGYDHPYVGYNPDGFKGWPRGDFFQKPPCAGPATQVAPAPELTAPAAPTAAPSGSTGGGCGGCRKATAVAPIAAAAPSAVPLLGTQAAAPAAAPSMQKLPWWVWVLALVAGAQLFDQGAT
jgi:hypothetical protein